MSHILSNKSFQESLRFDYAVGELRKLGFSLDLNHAPSSVSFVLNHHTVILYPYSGWFSGKGIKDGRGIHKLLNQLKS